MNNGVVELDDIDCACLGTGWIDLPDNMWGECISHFRGQLHPESHMLYWDDPKKLKEEENKSVLQYQIDLAKSRIRDIQKHLNSLELELVNRTITVQTMRAVRLEDYDIK